MAVRRDTTRPLTPEEERLMAMKHLWTCSCGITSVYEPKRLQRDTTTVPTQRCLRCGDEGPK